MNDFLDDGLAFKIGKVILKIELAKRETGKILRNLNGSTQEEILLQKFGKFYNQTNMWDRPDGLVVVTNNRLVFLSQLKTITTTTNYLSFPFEILESLQRITVWGFIPAIQFQVNQKVFIFTFLYGVNEIIKTINISKRGLLC